ncbi:MAG TPA: outer membrane lipoprotein carrier protein LolA [Beijerinckiaceae bacterium]|jgi:outer membrane lipoprotein-sorting protein
MILTRSSPIRPLLAGFALALAVSPAAAQFRWPWESAPAAPSSAQPAAPTPAPEVRTAPDARSAPEARTPSDAKAGSTPRAAAVRPPKRPANLPADGAAPTSSTTSAATSASAGSTSASPIREAAALPVAPLAAAATVTPAAVGPLSDAQAVAKANAYFNGLSTLVGDFVQIGADGRKLGGKLYLARPGKLRFEYEAPSALEVIADGRSVAVRDRKLATQDLYLISQTPLKFLVRDNIDLTRDVRVTSVATDGDGVRIALEDKATLGGTSKITLTFDRDLETLQRWRVIDPQGYTTTVSLSNLQKGRRVDPGLFVIDQQRAIETR